ncbi:N-acetylmuramoyl-L-alanine amidase family protein [Sulfuriroseicoccus oceanibius]|uniref:N-acetylmuramoyl-L-alanine amidase n=1 Tax=Sulfuriroseicoccus oceanibius TaxID=2707525 RepID=A0A6B3L965_9BACT|nr:N-acetylmuramoyl-L-alanine amidase [Sulfuriroseicoccus oceanibius]QQL45556.1 N-acetylmuramoyl-L-alanine amidase [Sulfuriroseicoccus oceanibius]
MPQPRTSPAFVPHLLRAVATLCLLVALVGTARADWNIVTHNGRDHVTAADIKSFYRFPELKLSGNTALWRGSQLWMKATIGSPELIINDVKFILSHPVTRKGRHVLVSRIDLAKLIDPVLRPDFIRQAQRFDTVVIDAGHGGHDPGAIGPYGKEKDFALSVAKRLGAILQRNGYKVKYTRSDDRFIPLKKRAQIGNSTPNSIFISIHFNSAKRTGAQGIETFALTPAGTASTAQSQRPSDHKKRTGNRRDAENIALATAVQNAVLKQINRYRPTDRGIKRARWTVLSGLTRPGILFEGGFVSNQTEGKRIATAAYQQQLAQGLATAIFKYRKAITGR